ncbi:unnamed protein product [Polarella glacialis]|uniref:D-lactate dehydrogenase (cytochrome) n=1 Tax=Polarella glacialis TaxID=89957 RepID=A0A813HD16_POLGL|nr:unnamed protein product [Polarella glacialis]
MSVGGASPLLLEALSAACSGRQHVLTDAASLAAASHDMSFHAPATPLAVARPGCPEEMAACIQACVMAGVPFLARGAGTGVEGGCIPYGGMVVLSTERLQKLRLHKESMLVEVGAGVRKDELNSFLRPHGLVFGPDPSSNPSLGGMAGTSGSGMTTLKYGTTRENVVSMVVVTPQGEVFRTRQMVRKSSSGYDLNNLYIGSEGTLGIICELAVKVWPLPKIRSGGIIEFGTVEEACRCVVQLHANLPPALLRCELLNAGAVSCTNQAYGTTLVEVPTLFLEFIGRSAEDLVLVRSEWDSVALAAEDCGGRNACFAQDGVSLDGLWDARRGSYAACVKYGRATGCNSLLITDVCVPICSIAACVAQTEADFQASGVPCVMCCHIADGNFHCLLPYNKRAPDQVATVRQLEHRLLVRALHLGGTVSGEHGVGVGKIAHACKEHGNVHIACQQAIKEALDPRGLLNPGKMLPNSSKL